MEKPCIGASNSPLIVVTPRGDQIPFPAEIPDVLVLTKWLELANQSLESGVYTVSFLEDEFDLPIVSVTNYGNCKWGTSRIDTDSNSPFVNVPFTPEDMNKFIDHLIALVPKETDTISFGRLKMIVCHLGIKEGQDYQSTLRRIHCCLQQ